MTKSFALNRQNKKIFGVCSGIADYFGIDATLVRLAFVATTLLGFGFPIIVYLVTPLIAD